MDKLTEMIMTNDGLNETEAKAKLNLLYIKMNQSEIKSFVDEYIDWLMTEKTELQGYPSNDRPRTARHVLVRVQALKLTVAHVVKLVKMLLEPTRHGSECIVSNCGRDRCAHQG